MKEKKTESLEDLFTGENTATLVELERMVNNFRKIGLQDNAKIPLSYIVSALYKNVPQNLQKNIKEIRTRAYIEGYNDGKALKGDKEDEQDSN